MSPHMDPPPPAGGDVSSVDGKDVDASDSVSDDSQTIGSFTSGTMTPTKTFQMPEKPHDEPQTSVFKPSKRLYIAFLTLAVITLMVALDGTSLSVALPIISQKLRGSAIEAFWSGTSFLLCSTIFQPSFASFSHIFGRKPLLFLALFLFTLGAIIAGVAPNFTVILVGRCFQGIGGGGLVALTEIIVTDLVPLKVRGKWFGIITGTWSIGSVTGPVVGGAFVQEASWRWIFYLNLPIVAIAGGLVYFCLTLNFKRSSIFAKLARVDYIGTVLFIASTTSILIPITWGGISYPWSSWHVIVPLVLGLCGITTFILWEIYFAKEQLIRLSIFTTTATTNLAYFNTTLHGIILWCLLYYLPLYYEAVQNYSPLITGVALFPQTFTVAPMAVITGLLITKFKKYRWGIHLGWGFATLGLGFLQFLDTNTSIPEWICLNLIAGVGMGILFPSMSFAVQASVKQGDLAFAVAMFSFFRMAGQCIGVAVGGTVFQNEVKKRLQQKGGLLGLRAGELAKDAAALVQTIKGMREEGPKAQEEVEGLIDAYAKGLKTVWLVLCVLSAVGLVTSFFIKEYSIEKELETEQGFVEGGNRERDAERGYEGGADGVDNRKEEVVNQGEKGVVEHWDSKKNGVDEQGRYGRGGAPPAETWDLRLFRYMIGTPPKV